MDELKNEIKKTIISALQLEDIEPENIVDSEKITVVPKKTDDKEENRESIKKDLISESRELSKSF